MVYNDPVQTSVWEPTMLGFALKCLVAFMIFFMIAGAYDAIRLYFFLNAL